LKKKEGIIRKDMKTEEEEEGGSEIINEK